MILFSNLNIQLNQYRKCLNPLLCICCKTVMSIEHLRGIFQNYYFGLKRSGSFDSFIIMHPSNQRCFMPGPPPYYNNYSGQNSYISDVALASGFNNYNHHIDRYWEEYYRYYESCSGSYYTNDLFAVSNNVDQRVHIEQKRNYSRRSNSAGDLPLSNESEMQAALKLLKTRVWETVEEPKADKKAKRGFAFTVMSYNVLAQHLISFHPGLYRRHNPMALRWETRWRNLYQEIKFLNPDILCLQEVQESHLDIYRQKFQELGYKGVYKKRTGSTVDGCAIFYKNDLLNLEEHETVEYYQPDCSVLNRNNVAIIAKFSPKLYPKKQFLVATTHLLFNPKREDVRLGQTQVLLAEIERISYKNTSKDESSQYLPIIITGDFNAEPNSSVYSLITKGTLKYEHLTSRSLGEGGSKPRQGKILVSRKLAVTDCCQHAKLVTNRQPNQNLTRSQEFALTGLRHGDRNVIKDDLTNLKIEKPEEHFSTGTLSHKFVFKSAYMHGQPGNCEATTYQDRWVTVDYIFYSDKKAEEEDQSLQLVSRYKLPLRTEFPSGVKIPNCLLGSDHLCLMSKFRLKVE